MGYIAFGMPITKHGLASEVTFAIDYGKNYLVRLNNHHADC
jgi:hypothetical protein